MDLSVSMQTTGLTLLVHHSIERLESASRDLSERDGSAILSIGRTVGDVLIDEEPRLRPTRVARVLSEQLRDLPSAVICSDVSLLFDPSLAVDPLSLFLDLARDRQLIMCWPGTYADDTLFFAVPSHRHHRTWRHPRATIIPLR